MRSINNKNIGIPEKVDPVWVFLYGQPKFVLWTPSREQLPIMHA